MNDLIEKELKFLTVSNLKRDHTDKSIAVTFDDGFENIYNFRDFFIEKNIKTTIFPITNYIGKYNKWDFSFTGNYFKHLSKNQLQELSNDGHEIGSHTLSHSALIYLNANEIKEELINSKNIIEDMTQKECNVISIPFGLINEKVYDLCMDSGYKTILLNSKLKFKKENLYRTKSVYFGDNKSLLKAKLGLNSLAKFETMRLDLINKCSIGTVILNYIKNKIKYK